jgi:uncharacterized BrkB/YihY/UPF0761 family membrane protein
VATVAVAAHAERVLLALIDQRSVDSLLLLLLLQPLLLLLLLLVVGSAASKRRPLY